MTNKNILIPFSIALFIIAGNVVAHVSGITGQVSKIFYIPPAGIIAGESIVRMAQVGAAHPHVVARQADFDAIKQHIANNENPWRMQYDTLMASASGTGASPSTWDSSDCSNFDTRKNKGDSGARQLATLDLACILSDDATVCTKAKNHLLGWVTQQNLDVIQCVGDQNSIHSVNSVILDAALSYDWLYNRLTSAEITQVSNWLSQAGQHVRSVHDSGSNRCHNKEAWDDATLAMVGLAVDNTDMVNYALGIGSYAASHQSIKNLIGCGIQDNGNVCDSVYHCNGEYSGGNDYLSHNMLLFEAILLSSIGGAENGYENYLQTQPRLNAAFNFYAELFQTNNLDNLDYAGADFAQPAYIGDFNWLYYTGIYEMGYKYFPSNTYIKNTLQDQDYNYYGSPTCTDCPAAPEYNQGIPRFCNQNNCSRWLKYPNLIFGQALTSVDCSSCGAWQNAATCNTNGCSGATPRAQTRTGCPAGCPTSQCVADASCGGSTPTCGDGACNGTETTATCPADCGGGTPTCGDGSCNGTETAASCPADCSGGPPPTCGDGTCNGTENATSCPADCSSSPTGFEWCNADDSLCKMGLGRAPAVAMDSTGKIHITYDCGVNYSSSYYPDYDVNYPRGGSTVCYRTWSCAGGISAEQKVGAGWGSRVAVDGHNRAHIVYHIMGSSGWDAIGYNQIDSAGQARFGTGGTTLVTMDGRIDKPRIAVNHADHVFVSYSDETGGGWKVAYVDFDPDTGPFSYSSRQGTNVHTGSKLSNGGIAVDGNDDVHFQWSVFDAGAGLWYGRVNGGIGNPVDVHNASNESASNFSDISAQWAGDNVSGAGEMGWGFGLYYLWGANSLTNVTKILENTVSNPNEVGPQHIDGDYLQTDIIVDARGTPYLTWTGYRNKHDGQDRMANYCDSTSAGGPHGAGTEDIVLDCVSQCNIDPLTGGSPDNCQELRWQTDYYVTMNAGGSIATGPTLVVDETTPVAAGQPQMSTRSRQGSKWTNPQSAAANNQGIITAFEYAVPDEPYNIFFKMIDGANICAQPVCDYDTICEPPLETVANCTDCITPPVCGNKIIETGEQCDDGNTISGDGCSSTCQLEHCDPNLDCDTTPKVDVFDLALLMYYWDDRDSTLPTDDTACGKNADFNADKLVDVGDLGWMATCWGSPMLPACVNNCPSPAAAATVQ